MAEGLIEETSRFPKTLALQSRRGWRLLLGVVFISLGCASRWVPAASIEFRVESRTPAQAFESALAAARAAGYHEGLIDRSAGYFRVRERLSRPVTWDLQHATEIREAFFGVQVIPPAVVSIRASGYYVRRAGTLMHRNLRAEMDAFAAQIAGAFRK